MCSLTDVQEVQKLNGRLVSLSRFLPKLAEKSEIILQIAQENQAFPMGRNTPTSLLSLQEDHRYIVDPESAQTRSTPTPISFSS